MLKETLEVQLPHLVEIINASFTSGSFPVEFKIALVRPLLKKPTLNKDSYKNYPPVSNLAFIGKVTDRWRHPGSLLTCRPMALRKNISQFIDSFTLRRQHSSRFRTTLLGHLGGGQAAICAVSRPLSGVRHCGQGQVAGLPS